VAPELVTLARDVIVDMVPLSWHAAADTSGVPVPTSVKLNRYLPVALMRKQLATVESPNRSAPTSGVPAGKQSVMDAETVHNSEKGGIDACGFIKLPNCT